jgi:hypothetical protein
MIRTSAEAELVHRLVERLDPADPTIARDHERLAGVRAARVAAAQDYFRGHAAEWDRIRRLHAADEAVEAEIRAMLVDRQTSCTAWTTSLKSKSGVTMPKPASCCRSSVIATPVASSWRGATSSRSNPADRPITPGRCWRASCHGALIAALLRPIPVLAVADSTVVPARKL